MKTILLDLDGVVLDLAGQVHRFAQKRLARKLPPPESWKTYDFREAMELTKSNWEFVHASFKRENKIGYLRQYYPQAQSFIEHLGFENRVVFCTSPWRGMPHWAESCYSLLDHFLNRRNYSLALTQDKHDIAGDWLIDDKWENLEKTPERGILFSRPWNEKYENWAHYIARNYADVIETIEKPVETPPVVATVAQTKVHEQARPSRKKTAKKKKR